MIMTVDRDSDKELDGVDRVSDVDSEATVDYNAQNEDDLDSMTGHVDTALPVTTNNSPRFLISYVEQLL